MEGLAIYECEHPEEAVPSDRTPLPKPASPTPGCWRSGLMNVPRCPTAFTPNNRARPHELALNGF